MLCPLVFSLEDMARRGGAFTWEPERGTRLGVMPRNGGNADVRWYDTDPCYVFHPLNAFEENGTLVLDVARYTRLDFMTPTSARDPGLDDDRGARMHRWQIDLAGGAVRSQRLDDVAAEFPRADERRLGRKHRWGYVAATGPEGTPRMPVFTAIRRYDLERGTIDARAFGPGNGVSEPLFVPRRADSAEDDGYVLVLAYDQSRDASDFYVLDARDIAGEPIARIVLPHRVPYGFHGNRMPAA
jgi:carotenoid cleavage dioxygenase